MLADHHAFVDVGAGPDQQLAARLEPVERVARGFAGPVGDHRAAGAVRQLAGPWHPARRVQVEQRGAARRLEQQGAESEQAAGRRFERDDRTALVAGPDVDHAPFPRRERLRHGADVIGRHIDDAALHRLVQHVVDRARDDLGPRNLELVAFATHGLDQHG